MAFYEYLDVKDLNMTREVYHPEIKKALGSLADCACDVYANCSTVDVSIKDMNVVFKGVFQEFHNNFDPALASFNNAMSGLDTIVHLNKNINGSIYEIEEPTELLTSCEELCECLGASTVSIIAAMDDVDDVLFKYTVGSITSAAFDDSVKKWGDWIFDPDSLFVAGASSAKEITEYIFKDAAIGKGLGFLLNSFANQHRSESSKYANFFSNIKKIGLDDSVSKAWLNVGTGAVVYAIADLVKYIDADEGSLLPKDIERIAGHLTIDTVSYAASATIAQVGRWAGAKVGALGGPVGAIAGYLVGALLVDPLSKKLHEWYSDAVGDTPIYSFELEGQSYDIPKNGIGENGDYDALFSRYEEALSYNRLHDKETMYYDWEYFVFSNANGNILNWTDDYVTPDGVEQLAYMLEEVYQRSISERRDPQQCWYELLNEGYNSDDSEIVASTKKAFGLYDGYLWAYCGFDIREFVKEQHYIRTDEKIDWI